MKKLQTVDLLTSREKAAEAQGILFQQAFCKSELFQVIIFHRCHLLNASPQDIPVLILFPNCFSNFVAVKINIINISVIIPCAGIDRANPAATHNKFTLLSLIISVERVITTVLFTLLNRFWLLSDPGLSWLLSVNRSPLEILLTLSGLYYKLDLDPYQQ